MIIFLISYQNHYVVTPHLNHLIETYVVTPHLNRLKTVQMNGHNIYFYVELTKIFLHTR